MSGMDGVTRVPHGVPHDRSRSRCLGVISGAVLRISRRGVGLTQEGIAAELDVDVSTVQGWESGRRPLTALRLSDLLRVRTCLTAFGADAETGRHLVDAVEADLLLSTAIGAGSDPDPLVRTTLGGRVHRRAFTNLLTWPLTDVLPPQFRRLSSPGRMRDAAGPRLTTEERDRFFDHMIEVAIRTEPRMSSPLRRQAVYLLGFDRRHRVRSWLTADWQRVTHRPVADGDLPGFLAQRSAALALASAGDQTALLDFVAYEHSERDELANLNYWAHWLGDTTGEQGDDAFMRVARPAWNGATTMAHLTARMTDEAPHLALNLRSMHSLIAMRPSLLSEFPSAARALADRLALLDDASAAADRDQVAGLRYAIRLADRR